MTKRRILLVGLLLLNGAGASALGSTTASGHSEVGMYDSIWERNRNVRYNIDNNVADGWRASINNGFTRWSDRASGRAPNFIYDGVATMQGAYTPCAGANGVFARNLDQDGWGPTNGLTAICVTEDPNYITGFTMVFDTVPSNNTPHPNGGWYVGDGDPPEDKIDLRSTSAHEAGHATGWGRHFSDTGAQCPATADVHTMCGFFAELLGTSWRRTLEPHDIHTLENAYAPIICC